MTRHELKKSRKGGIVNAVFILLVVTIICWVYCLVHRRNQASEVTTGISMYRKEGNIVNEGATHTLSKDRRVSATLTKTSGHGQHFHMLKDLKK